MIQDFYSSHVLHKTFYSNHVLHKNLIPARCYTRLSFHIDSSHVLHKTLILATCYKTFIPATCYTRLSFQPGATKFLLTNDHRNLIFIRCENVAVCSCDNDGTVAESHRTVRGSCRGQAGAHGPAEQEATILENMFNSPVLSSAAEIKGSRFLTPLFFNQLTCLLFTWTRIGCVKIRSTPAQMRDGWQTVLRIRICRFRIVFVDSNPRKI